MFVDDQTAWAFAYAQKIGKFQSSSNSIIATVVVILWFRNRDRVRRGAANCFSNSQNIFQFSARFSLLSPFFLASLFPFHFWRLLDLCVCAMHTLSIFIISVAVFQCFSLSVYIVYAHDFPNIINQCEDFGCIGYRTILCTSWMHFCYFCRFFCFISSSHSLVLSPNSMLHTENDAASEDILFVGSIVFVLWKV